MTILKKPAVLDLTTGQLRDLAANETLDVTISQTNVRSLQNGETGALVICQAVYVSGNGTIKKAKADATATTGLFGIVYDSSVAAGATGVIATDGSLTATTAQWDVVTGDVGGLVAGTNYYLSDATAGSIAKVPPAASGSNVVRVGKAVSATVLELNIGEPYLLA